jgi:hypothetical protein
MTYNKKQMQPLIDKYQINPETNKLFISVVEMFDGQTNYQNWAVKMIFSQTMTFDELKEIHDWIVNNQNLISKLEKKNIVSYTNKSGIGQLKKEIKGLEMIGFIKNIISHFNTDQRKILTKALLDKEYTGIEACESAKIKKWYDTLRQFNKKPMGRKNNFYSTCSALKNADALLAAINSCLEEAYEWDKDDMLAFLEHNASDCEIVYNEGPYVIVRVPSFDSSHKLCGSGRTQWCITRESHFFSDYVTRYSGKRDQYFLFDFSRKETDCFAHVGFTVEGGSGIIIAQTCDNRDMMGDFKQGNEVYSINKLLGKIGVKASRFMRLPSNVGFNWAIASVIEMVKKNPSQYAIAFEKDGRLILNILNKSGFDKLVCHTFIKSGNFCVDNNNKLYLFMDFNLQYNDDMSMIAMQYRKDQYGTLSLIRANETFGADLTKQGYLSKLGIATDEYLNREAIDPSILLHKLIDENDEVGAIALIEKEREKIDVNYEFNTRVPVFSAINNRMYKLFDAIVNHPKFDSKIEDGFGETLLESLLYLYGSDEIVTSKEDNKLLTTMITSILSSKTFDFNAIDLNHDTAINVACEFPSEVWAVKALASKKNVDINVVNDFGCAALGQCIVNNNLEALKIIGQRPDLKVREEDKKLAKSYKIDLKEYIKPNEDVFKEEAISAEESLEYELEMAALH